MSQRTNLKWTLALFALALLILIVSAGFGFGWPSVFTNSAPPTTYLVVLEHNWEKSLAEKQYSAGDLMRAFFAAHKLVEVRHRYYTDTASLKKWLHEVAEIPGDVVLVIADHGSPFGLYTDEDYIGPRAIATGLEAARNLKMIHFSACSTFRGPFPAEVIRQMGQDHKEHAVPVTGYSTDVDWTISAMTDFMLLDLVLRGHSPMSAWVQTQRMMPIAGFSAIKGCGYEPLGLMIMEPDFVFRPAHIFTLGDDDAQKIGLQNLIQLWTEGPKECVQADPTRIPAAVQQDDGDGAGFEQDSPCETPD